MLFRKKSTSYLTLSIPEPCSEDWSRMHIVDDRERHCASCAKNVVDFTNMSDNELVLYFRHAQGKVCGRLRDDQLHRGLKAIPHTTPVSGWWKAAMLLPFTLLAKTSSGQNDSLSVADTSVVITGDSLVPDSVVQTIAEIQIDTINKEDSVSADRNTEQRNQKESRTHQYTVTVGDVMGCLSPALNGVPAENWFNNVSFFPRFKKIRSSPGIENPSAHTSENDPSKPPADPVPPVVPETPWYEAILPSTFRIRRNG